MSFLKEEVKERTDELVELIVYGDVDSLGEEVIRDEVVMLVNVAIQYGKESK